MKIFWQIVVPVVGAMLIIAFVAISRRGIESAKWSSPKSVHFTEVQAKVPGLELQCVWEKKTDRFHLVVDHPYIKTACERHVSFGSRKSEGYLQWDRDWVRGTLEDMEKARKIPCGDCIRALDRFTESINARPRSQMPLK